MPRANRSSRAEWAKRVERWRDSGLTAREFGAETGLNPSSLLYWSSQLRTSGGSERRAEVENTRGRSKGVERRPPAQKARFVEVSPVAAVTSSSSNLEVVLPSGAVVRVPADFEEATLSRVVSVLEGAR